MNFAELHCVTNYSFLRGAAHPEELVERAARLGYRAIAITDECSFAGLAKAHVAAKAHDMHLIVGAEFQLEEGCRLVLLAPDRDAYGQISALITRLRRRSPKGTYQARLTDFRWALDRCLALWIPPLADIGTLMEQGRSLQALFPELWIALELFREACDLDKTAHALTLSMRLDLPIVASNDVHLHAPERQPLQDVLTAIRHRTTVAEIGSRGFQNAERCLRPIEQLETLYPPEMLEESCRIAERCSFSLTELRYEYPEELVPPHLTPAEYLRQLTFAGAAERWPDGIPDDARALLERELELISQLDFEYYFLTVQDIVQFARSQSILCQGRGSAANSAVCYALHVTEVDPSRMHLLFERFVNQERNEPPDIDVDFEHERREEVIQYIYKRYGRERAALAATLITYRPKSAIRDVGKALGMGVDTVDLLAKSLAWWDDRHALAERFAAVGLDPESEVVKRFRYFVDQILGFPRHLSQHVGGFVISRGPLAQLVPVENAAMAERTVIQWDKDDLEALGLLKVDVLGLGMLTAIRKALEALNAHRAWAGGQALLEPTKSLWEPFGSLWEPSPEGDSPSGEGSHREEHKPAPLTVATIPPEDPETYAMLQRGDSMGVFQVESRAQMAMLPRLKPRHFYDLVIEVAIVRPGPIQGDMVHPYLRRRQGIEPVEYPNDDVRQVLERTLGVPIFQEQVIELAVVAAGFTPGQADQLRRAMAAWKRRGGLGPFEQMIIDGMLERGHDRDFAERVFRQIQGFGEYGFPESHAASFALLVYVSAWLKCHAPAAFYCGLLNSLPMGFYSPSQLIQDARRHGIEVQPVNVQHSDWDHRLAVEDPEDPAGSSAENPVEALSRARSSERPRSGERSHRRHQDGVQPPLRLGLRLVKGLSEAAGQRIAAARPFTDTEDLARRAGLDDRSLRCLARGGALESLSRHRYHAHWEVAAIHEPLALEAAAAASAAASREGDGVPDTLPAPTAVSDMLDDYRYLGLTLGDHPVALLRAHDALQGYLALCHSAAELERCRHGQFVRVMGLVTGRQRPGTASGVLFVTLEDDTGNVNLVVWSSVLEQFRPALLQGQLLRVKGTVEREQEVIHVVAGYVEDMSGLLGRMHESTATDALPFHSRDFR